MVSIRDWLVLERLYKENRRQESNENSIQQHDHQKILQRRMIAAPNIANKHFTIFLEPNPPRKALDYQIQHDCDEKRVAARNAHRVLRQLPERNPQRGGDEQRGSVVQIKIHGVALKAIHDS